MAWKRLPTLVLLWSALTGLSTLAAGPVKPPEAPSIDPASVRRAGAGYRYPCNGWIVVHIEGSPYDRGYQHGKLLGPEIADFIHSIATYKGSKAPDEAWKANRRLVDSLFLRRYEPEYLEEMKGIADGAAAAGAKFEGRSIDLIDVVAINSDIEVSFLDEALGASSHGLENKRYSDPTRPLDPSEGHCSAFAATGPATKDGKIVFGHITMWNIFHAQHFNIWLDVKPEHGHRVLMQTYPGGIQSGTDYYLNDHGLLAAETTIEQTAFHADGKPLAGRMRHALQYGKSIDDVVAALREGNNGLYTNEWLLGDINTNEIAMFELGTHKDRLWRSSKNEWYGGTEGFYWGCNNAKDLNMRLETLPSLEARPSNVVFHPSDRDRAWLKLFDAHQGKIDASFGFEAFTTPPLAGFPSLDAKFTTSAMAARLETFALFGPPMGKTWEPSPEELSRDPSTRPIVANDWSLLRADPPLATAPTSTRPSIDQAGSLAVHAAPIRPPSDLPPLWRGTILPAADADLWLAAAFAEYERIAAFEKTIGYVYTGLMAQDAEERVREAFLADPEVREVVVATKAAKVRLDDFERRVKQQNDPALRASRARLEELRGRYEFLWSAREASLRKEVLGVGVMSQESKEALDLALFALKSRYLTAVRRNGGRDTPLSEIKSDLRDGEWYPIASGKGVLLLRELRKAMNHSPFEAAMEKFGREHAGKPATSAEFFRTLEATHGKSLAATYDPFLKGSKTEPNFLESYWSIDSFEVEPENALIVYGTTGETDAQREAAALLQRKIERRWYNKPIAIKADIDLAEADWKGRHLILVGRPSTNAATSRFADALPVAFGPGSFRFRGETYGHERSAIVVAAENPRDPRYSIVVFAGLSAEATRRVVQTQPHRGNPPTPALLLPAGGSARAVMTSSTAD